MHLLRVQTAHTDTGSGFLCCQSVQTYAQLTILVEPRLRVCGAFCREVLVCLLPFAACFFLGTGIGVGVGHDENPWVDIVLFGLIAGQI